MCVLTHLWQSSPGVFAAAFVAQGELLFFFGCRVFVLLQYLRQFGELGGSFAQVTQSAAAAQVHFAPLFVRERDAVAVAAVLAVSGEVQVAHDVLFAVFIGVAAGFSEGVAVAVQVKGEGVNFVEKYFTQQAGPVASGKSVMTFSF